MAPAVTVDLPARLHAGFAIVIVLLVVYAFLWGGPNIAHGLQNEEIL